MKMDPALLASGQAITHKTGYRAQKRAVSVLVRYGMAILRMDVIGIDCRADHFRDPFLASNALTDGVKTRHAAPASPASVSANTSAPLPIACGDEYSSGR